MDICVIVGVIACTDATLSELKIEFDVMEKMFMALCMHTSAVCRKENFLGKDD